MTNEVNIENINKIILLIENEENYFNMRTWYAAKDMMDYKAPANVCGTPSCIGGWCEAVIMYEQNIPSDEVDISEWLGLDEESLDALFFPNVETNEGIFASRSQALDHLRHIAAGGEVDWAKFAPIGSRL